MDKIRCHFGGSASSRVAPRWLIIVVERAPCTFSGYRPSWANVGHPSDNLARHRPFSGQLWRAPFWAAILAEARRGVCSARLPSGWWLGRTHVARHCPLVGEHVQVPASVCLLSSLAWYAAELILGVLRHLGLSRARPQEVTRKRNEWVACAPPLGHPHPTCT